MKLCWMTVETSSSIIQYRSPSARWCVRGRVDASCASVPCVSWIVGSSPGWGTSRRTCRQWSRRLLLAARPDPAASDSSSSISSWWRRAVPRSPCQCYLPASSSSYRVTSPMWAGKTYRYVASYPDQLSLPSLRGRLIEYQPFLPGSGGPVRLCQVAGITYGRWHPVALRCVHDELYDIV